MNTLTIELPSIYCPIAVRENPLEETLRHHGMEWLRRFGFCDRREDAARLDQTDAHAWLPRMVPSDTSVDVLQLLVDWTYLAYVMDDQFDRSATTLSDAVDLGFDALNALESPPSSLVADESPLGAAWCDLARRGRACSTAAVFHRWAQEHRGWLLGVARETSCISRGGTLSLDEWVRVRPLAGGAWVTMAAIELATGEVPGHEIQSDPVRALVAAAALTGEVDNDLFSYGRDIWLSQNLERGKRFAVENVVDILARRSQCAPSQAIAEAVALRDASMSCYLQLRDRVTPSASPPLQRYITAVGKVVARNLNAGLTMERYTNPDGLHPGAVKIESSISQEPPADALAPLTMPALAWWLDSLPARTLQQAS
ncbi:terpene synthase family protein [Streptomyces cyaneus]|uniref:terpene synthase family protein n=1 Tax=Streptomyces cyaneus TaxID=1904 RepID=UPI000FF8B4D1|nr:hypothetical protein [Streptomyces cyaneus]